MSAQIVNQTIRLLEWNESFRIGVDKVDEQHQRLFAIANRFFDEVAKGESCKTVYDALDQLRDYATEHFADEEALMSVTRFPYFEQHQAAHQQFTDEVQRLRRELFQGNQDLSLELLAFLRNWLVEHILGSDKYAGNYIQERLGNLANGRR